MRGMNFLFRAFVVIAVAGYTKALPSSSPLPLSSFSTGLSSSSSGSNGGISRGIKGGISSDTITRSELAAVRDEVAQRHLQRRRALAREAAVQLELHAPDPGPRRTGSAGGSGFPPCPPPIQERALPYVTDPTGLSSGILPLTREPKCALDARRRERAATNARLETRQAETYFNAAVRKLPLPLIPNELIAVGSDVSQRPELVHCLVNNAFRGRRRVMVSRLYFAF